MTKVAWVGGMRSYGWGLEWVSERGGGGGGGGRVESTACVNLIENEEHDYRGIDGRGAF